MIRNATFFDVPEILKMSDEYMRTEVSPCGHHSDIWDAGMMADNLMSSINSDDEIVLVSIRDGAIQGFLWAASHCLGPWSPVRVSSDYLFYIDPAYRGTFTAARLVRAYKEWATELGCKEIRLSVASGIHHGRTSQLYSALGFVPFAITYNHKT